jgi:hypothetical protein
MKTKDSLRSSQDPTQLLHITTISLRSILISEISGHHLEAEEICILLGYSAVSNGKGLPSNGKGLPFDAE